MPNFVDGKAPRCIYDVEVVLSAWQKAEYQVDIIYTPGWGFHYIVAFLVFSVQGYEIIHMDGATESKDELPSGQSRLLPQFPRPTEGPRFVSGLW